MNTRRQFIKSAAAFAALGSLAPTKAFSKANTQVKKGKTLLVVFLRGGIDGLNVIVPFGDKHYYEHRNRIAIPRPGNGRTAIDLDGFFGLHPSAQALEPWFKSGVCRAMQAVGYSKNTRSHFQEQDTWETGISKSSISSDGWLNRHLHSSQGHGTIRAVSIGGNLPRILRGKAAAYSMRSVSDLTMPSLPGKDEVVFKALQSAYCQQPDAETIAAHQLMAQTADATLEGAKQLREVAKQKYKPQNGAKYQNKSIHHSFQEAARLIRANIGTEIIQIDFGGWDTHNNQGGSYGGFANRLADLTSAMDTFAKDLGDKMEDVLVLSLSDFGRTVRENGTSGTDHGWANCLLTMGGSESGKAGRDPVLGKWPGLAPDQLHQNRDLKHTTDFRDLIGDAITKHLGNKAIDYIIPKHNYQATELIS